MPPAMRAGVREANSAKCSMKESLLSAVSSLGLGDAYPRPALQASSGAITSETIAITLMRMFMLGPEVSLNGSPTVSPTTVAA